MFAQHEYKEGIIYSKKGFVYAKIEFSLSSQDEVVYETLKEIRSLIHDQEALIKISYVQDKITDKKPEAPTSGEGKEETFDSKLILPKFKYIIDNMIFSNEQIYGQNLDGKEREYRILWKGSDGKEYFVPLQGFDDFEAKNPNGAYSYNSDTKEILFSSISNVDVEYILRRYRSE